MLGNLNLILFCAWGAICSLRAILSRKKFVWAMLFVLGVLFFMFFIKPELSTLINKIIYIKSNFFDLDKLMNNIMNTNMNSLNF